MHQSRVHAHQVQNYRCKHTQFIRFYLHLKSCDFMLMVDDYVCRAPHYRDSWRDHDGQNDNNIDMV